MRTEYCIGEEAGPLLLPPIPTSSLSLSLSLARGVASGRAGRAARFNLSLAQMLTRRYLPRSAHPPACASHFRFQQCHNNTTPLLLFFF